MVRRANYLFVAAAPGAVSDYPSRLAPRQFESDYRTFTDIHSVRGEWQSLTLMCSDRLLMCGAADHPHGVWVLGPCPLCHDEHVLYRDALEQRPTS